MSSKIKVFLVDDHQLFREGLRFLLSKIDSIEIVGEAENGKVFLEMMQKQTADIILMDINMPVMNGIEATEEILKLKPDLKIIALSMNGDEVYYYKMIHAGVNGFVLKKAGSHELQEAIETVHTGGDFFSQELLKNVIINFGAKKETKQDSDIKFTSRETEVLKLICKGDSVKEIANELNISPRTVEGHKTKLMNKCSARNTSNLIMIAIKNQYIEV